VDFYCPEEMLIIELDGDAHGEYNQIVKDECRDNYLNNLGFIIIRFENKLVFKDPEFVINEIIKNFSDKQ
jgi:very-short-patch-repair endonuclease